MRLTVLNYTGVTSDRGGVVSLVRALSSSGRFECKLGVSPGFKQSRTPALDAVVFPPMDPETINVAAFARGFVVARSMRAWLAVDPWRVYHGRSRAGLIVALWLRLMGEGRAVATVHSLGRRTWFYRMASAVLGSRLFWLGPSMKRHYGIGDSSWAGCLTDCVPESSWCATRADRGRGKPVLFGCAGSLVEVKQWELVLRALAAMSPEVHVCVVHAGGEDGTAASAAYAARLRALTAKLGLADRVQWLGETADLPSFYSRIDCLLTPSRWEASSMAALEAAFAGVPLLASDQSGTRDLIEKAKLGWLFESGSPASLAREMAALATGTRLSEWSRDEAALRTFAAPTVAEAHLEAYSRLVPPSV